jgi:hypothetical protein
MMECADIRERLSEYIDGILDSETEARVEEHLGACERCREEFSSLEAVVNELSALESVSAPDDFLEKLHQRIESRFTFRRLIQILFVPARTKIPLEVATAAALVMLIFAGLYIREPKRQLAMAPEESENMGLAQKTAMDRAELPLEEEAGEAEPVFKVALEEKGKEERPVELVFLLEPDTTRSRYAGRTVPKAAQAPEEEELSGEGGLSDMVPLSSGEGPEQEIPVGRLEPEEMLLSVKELIKHVEGTVVSLKYDEETQQLRTIHAEIPSRNYPFFYQELTRLAPLRAPPQAISEEDQETIPVRITVVAPE